MRAGRRRPADRGLERRRDGDARIVGHVAVNVFKESVRDKVLYNLVVFAVLLIAVSYLLGQLTAGQDVKIIKDLGLAAIATFGLLIAVFIGIGLVWKEVERRSIYSLLSKPIRRPEFVLGKYAGLVLTLLVNVAVMTVAFYAVLALHELDAVPTSIARGVAGAGHRSAACCGDRADLHRAAAGHRHRALLLDLLEPVPVGGADVRPLGRSATSTPTCATSSAVVESPRAAELARGLYYVLPNFAAFDIKTQVVHGLPVPAAYVATTAVVRRGLHRAAARRRGRHVLAARLQVSAAAIAVHRSSCCSARVVGLQAVHERRGGPPAAPTPNMLYVRSPEAHEARWRCRTTRCSPTSTGFARCSTTAARSSRPIRTSSYDLLYPLLDLTTSLDPQFNVAYRFGAIFLAEPPPGGPGRAGSGHRAAGEGAARAAAASGSSRRPSASSTTGGGRTMGGGRVVQARRRMPNAPIWLAPLAAVTLAQGGSRESSRAALAGDRATSRGRVVPQRGAAAAAAARCDGSDRSASGGRRRVPATRSAACRRTGTSCGAPATCAARRSIRRHAVSAGSSRARHASTRRRL